MNQKYFAKIKRISTLKKYKFIVEISFNNCGGSSKKKKTSLIHRLNPTEIFAR